MEWLVAAISFCAYIAAAMRGARSGKWFMYGLLMAAWAFVPLLAFQGSTAMAVTGWAFFAMLLGIPIVLPTAVFIVRLRRQANEIEQANRIPN